MSTAASRPCQEFQEYERRLTHAAANHYRSRTWCGLPRIRVCNTTGENITYMPFVADAVVTCLICWARHVTL